MDMPVIRFKQQPVVVAYPCAFCWGKRVCMTDIRDEANRPICADCAGRKLRQLALPSFVLDHICETFQ